MFESSWLVDSAMILIVLWLFLDRLYDSVSERWDRKVTQRRLQERQDRDAWEQMERDRLRRAEYREALDQISAQEAREAAYTDDEWSMIP